MPPLHAGVTSWSLAQIGSQREFRVPPVATWARQYGSRAGRRLGPGRRDGGRLVLVGGRHRGSDPRSNQPVHVLAHQARVAYTSYAVGPREDLLPYAEVYFRGEARAQVPDRLAPCSQVDVNVAVNGTQGEPQAETRLGGCGVWSCSRR